jgi:chromosomal replication initiator protein
MGKAVDVAAAPASASATSAASAQPVVETLSRAFRARIGADRFAVWFGNDLDIVVAGGLQEPPHAVIMRAGNGFTHDWLRRTFKGEFEAVVREVCGSATCVTWEPLAEKLPGTSEASAAPEPATAATGRPRRRATSRRVGAEKVERNDSERLPADDKAAGRPAAVSAARPRTPRLEDFVVGPSNRMAFGAVEMAVTRPGEMSPLVIHGPSGVGKTHLLEAVCQRAREMNSGLHAVYLAAEQFTTGFLQSLHGSGLPGFRRSCRSADLLVIDDLQFFVGKRATILELQHTLDTLQRQGKQVVVGSDRDLDALTDLGPDLLTRLRGGMNARILPPDYEVRRGIVAAICGRRGLAVPDEVVHHVATHMTRHARELYGAVNRLEATSLMLGVPVSEELAVEALADLVRSSGRSVRLADVERAVCKAFGIASGSLQTAKRARNVNHPRMLAMFLARKHTHAALAEIGSYFGRRSHSTVIAAQRTVDEWVMSRSQVVLAEASWDVDEAIRRVEDLLRAG